MTETTLRQGLTATNIPINGPLCNIYWLYSPNGASISKAIKAPTRP
jgi:hypothetical protein